MSRPRPIKNAKPCPFCGNTKITYVQGEDGWFIGCRYIGGHEACNALIGDSSSKARLLEKWNKRGEHAPLDQYRIATILGASSVEPVGKGGPIGAYQRMKSKAT